MEIAVLGDQCECKELADHGGCFHWKCPLALQMTEIEDEIDEVESMMDDMRIDDAINATDNYEVIGLWGPQGLDLDVLIPICVGKLREFSSQDLTIVFLLVVIILLLYATNPTKKNRSTKKRRKLHPKHDRRLIYPKTEA